MLTGQSRGTRNGLVQSMLGRGELGRTVLPGAVSSTTVSGYLPHQYGYAAASLSPALANAVNDRMRPPSKQVDDKAAGDSGNSPSGPAAEKRGENCPP